MKYTDYIEHRKQGTFNFPIAYYHQTPLSPRYQMPYHWHTHYEIMRIISGSFHLTLDNETVTYHAGDVIFITQGVLHGGEPDDCIYECIVFDLNMLMKDNHACANTIQNIMNGKIMINRHISQKCDKILPIVKSLCHVLSEKKPGYEFMTQGYLYILIGTIIEEKLYEESVCDTLTKERLNSVKNVLDFISDNYSDSISLGRLARIAGMNPKYFCRYFKSMTGRTPIDYLNYYRVECACEMLSTKNISVKETAISCGFSDESYFVKTFRKYRNTTPKQFTRKEF
ncbi:MAG: AraC family transcriptional regulator [Lachnospiraceae bacterium]|nr:AraC family transcriptional regulator [Lachnospiraceae bacterium]